MRKPKINPLRLLLPPWRLGSNVRSADDDIEIGKLSDDAVVAEWYFAAMVVIGVAAEFVIAAHHPPYNSWWGQWGPAYGDLLVAGGVAGEVGASVISHLCQGELTRRSNDRLVETEKRAAELRTFAAYRHIPPDKLRQISDSLRTLAPSIILFIEWERSDTEALWYANEIADAFRHAGVNQIGGLPNSFIDREVFGVWLQTAPGIDANAIWEVFREAGVSMGTEIWNALRVTPMQPSPNVRVFVGHKQLPESPLFASQA